MTQSHRSKGLTPHDSGTAGIQSDLRTAAARIDESVAPRWDRGDKLIRWGRISVRERSSRTGLLLCTLVLLLGAASPAQGASTGSLDVTGAEYATE